MRRKHILDRSPKVCMKTSDRILIACRDSPLEVSGSSPAPSGVANNDIHNNNHFLNFHSGAESDAIVKYWGHKTHNLKTKEVTGETDSDSLALIPL